MTTLAAPTKALVDFTQEIRFAVVMYGGSSLAIYMNGVAQELLRLVRATAPALTEPSTGDGSGDPTEALYQQVGGSEAVYRKLGRMLSRGAEPDLAAKDDDDAPLRTRFVIDILSGTSAGGINAVFLAKALANNQEMDELKQMWVEQADMGVLINDQASDADINLGPQDPPRSLLNSRRMYYQLLDALQRMDTAAQEKRRAGKTGEPAAFVSPFVEELDLFTTATDIWGQSINVRLADTLARERRHLNTFHFRFSSKQADGVGQNDFAAEFNPFLAFAARVTSAHPAPFEPMRLADIDEVLDRHEAYRDVAGFRSDDPRWEAFFEEYLQRPDGAGSKMRGTTAEERQSLRKVLAEKFRARPFSDGGVLDNSPFSFAIDKLQHRHTRLPVDRKLIYIEPVPEHPERESPPGRPPDALTNGWLSLSALPRYQFIRDDLQRLLERNRLIERVNRILQGVERDEVERMRKHTRARGNDPAHIDRSEAPLSSYEFGQKTIGEMIERMGSAWGGYQRLRVAETTDELVMMIGRAAGFDEESDEYMAIRYLVRTWRLENYDAYGEGFKGYLDSEMPQAQAQALKKAGAAAKDSENLFLYRYDLKWRLRRLKFVLGKAEEISCLDEHALELLGIASDAPEVSALLTRATQRPPNETKADDAVLIQERVRRELRAIKYQLSERLRDLHVTRHQLFSRSRSSTPSGQNKAASSVEGSPLQQAIEKLEISAEDILRILDKATDPERQKVAEDIINTKKQKFDLFLNSLDNYLRKVLDDAAARIRGEKEFAGRGILESPEQLPNPLTPEYLVRRTLLYFYENFDRYDVISYPVLYSTNVGEETDVIEVFRISPEDARVLIKDEELRRRKLAGTSLGNFGAFFDRDFRTNDILWGRLDCADRIITALLSSAAPQTEAEQQELERTKRELVEEASRAIIAEELSATDKTSLHGLLAAALVKAEQSGEQAQFIPELEKLLKQLPAIEKLLEQRTPSAPDLSKVRGFLNDCLTGTDPLERFIKENNFKHELSPATLVRISARASKVFGKMLEGIADVHRVDRKRVIWLTRLAQLFWGLVEVAVPDSLPNLVFRHWLKLLYFFETLLVLGGTLLLNPTIQQFGFFAFIITATLHIIVLMLGDAMTVRENPAGRSGAVAADGKQRKRAVWPILKTAAFIIIFFLTILGTLLLATIFGADTLWPLIQKMAQPEAVGEAANRVGQIAAQAGQIAQPVATFSFRLIARWAMIAAVIIVFLGTIRADLKTFVKDSRAFSVRIVGLLALLMGLGICGLMTTGFLSLKAINQSLPGNFYQTALALELAQSTDEVSRIEQTVAEDEGYADVTGGPTAVEQSRRKLSRDVRIDFLFILLYTLVNLASCYWLSQRNFRSRRLAQTLGIMAAVCSVAAAVFDVRENLLLFKVLGDHPTIEIIQQLSFTTHIKWAAIFVTLALLSLIFIRRQRSTIVAGLFLLLTAATGLYGLFVREAIQWAFVMIGIGMILIGVLMTFKPFSFLEGLTASTDTPPANDEPRIMKMPVER